MPRLGPPSDSPPPPDTPVTNTKSQKWYDDYFNVPSWICPKCITTNFGRNKYCAGCYGRTGIKEMRNAD